MTGKQRAQLRSMANGLETIIQVGKGDITENLIKQTDDALTARELIKGSLLETCPIPVRDVATQLAQAVNAEIIQVIGRRFVLYRENPQDKKIFLSK